MTECDSSQSFHFCSFEEQYSSMDLCPNQHSVDRLITLLESLLTSTHRSKVGLEAQSTEAQNLLHGWILPEREDPNNASSCQCAESKKQQLTAFLERVEKAVKYSQSIREGRSDFTSPPWSEDIESNSSKAEARKLNSVKGATVLKGRPAHSREKLNRVKLLNGTLRSSNSSSPVNLHETNVHSSDEQDLHSVLCPLHGSFQKTKNVETVGLAEALDVRGIPPELVTVLKSVHHYINRLRTANVKNRAETSFLRRLNSVNEARWEKFTFLHFLKELPIISSKAGFGKIPMFAEDDEELKDIPTLSTSHLNDSLSAMGLWNPAVCSIISVGALCVQYQNEEIWNLLQMRMQQLQVSQAEWQICEILSCDPLLCNPDLNPPSAPLFLKAATALSKLGALNLPVLVKTCHGQ